MPDQFYTINLRAYLDKDESTYIGEADLQDLLSDFSCPHNPDVEYFLTHNAIEFTKKDQSITYLVFRAEDASLAGYYSLAVKPISVNVGNISRTMAKKLARVSTLDENTLSYTTAAYLIAQLGNKLCPSSKQAYRELCFIGICIKNNRIPEIFHRRCDGVFRMCR